MEKGYEPTEKDQQQIIRLITMFARSEPNVLKYSEVVMLMLDRCMFNNKFTLTDFQPLFEAALKVKANRPSDKTQIQGEKVMNKQQLIFLFHEASKILFKPDPRYHQKFYNTFLSEKVDSQNGEINRSRVMLFDDHTKKLLVEEGIRQLCQYQQQIKHIFISYMIENYWSVKKSRRLLLTFREILLQNKKWSYISFILFLKQSESIPHLLSIEHTQQVMRLIIPNINSKQQQFYSRHTLSDGYHKDVDGHEEGSAHPGDPGIMLFEFQLLLLKISFDSFPKELEKKDMGSIFDRYMKYLYFRKNEDLKNGELPNIQRKMIIKMKEYFKSIETTHHQAKKVGTEEQSKESQFEILAKKMQKQIVNAPQLNLDFNEIFKTLDKQLTKMPPVPIVEQECPGPYDKNNVITIGQQPPPQPVQKNEKPKAQKKQAGKKDQIPPRQFKWAEVPVAKLSAEDYMKQIQTKLQFQVKPLGDISRGAIDKEGYPVIIGQILFPPQLPKSVVQFVQASSNALADRNFILAIDNLNNGVLAWKKTNVEFDSAAQLFFQYSKGNIYLSAGKIQYAIQSFYNCRKFADTSRLSFANPDRSLPYYGLGEVFYEIEEYEFAARSFLKARQIRQAVLGLQHVQTASVFNNLACCFFMLRRSHEALGYIEIAQVVMDTELGAHHQRTMTCRTNLKKINRGYFQNTPQYRKFWQVFEEDKFEKKKKKKKDGDDKKKK